MQKLIRIAVLILGMFMVFVAPPMAYGEDTEVTGTPYAFAVQGSCETPGYIHINHLPNVHWMIEGENVTVTAPSSQFPFPGGIQAEVKAIPNQGYYFGSSTVDTFFLQVNPQPSGAACPQPVEAVNEYAAWAGARDAKRTRFRLEGSLSAAFTNVDDATNKSAYSSVLVKNSAGKSVASYSFGSVPDGVSLTHSFAGLQHGEYQVQFLGASGAIEATRVVQIRRR